MNTELPRMSIYLDWKMSREEQRTVKRMRAMEGAAVCSA